MCRSTFHVAFALVVCLTAVPAPADEPVDDGAKTRAAKRDDANKTANQTLKLRSADLTSVIPRWNLRDQWTVETVTKRVQRRKALNTGELVSPIQWRFAVSKFEKSFGEDCFRVEVDCLAGEDGHPRSVLWFDRQSLVLRRMASEVPTQSGYRTMTVSYVHDPDQPSPVLDTVASIPIAAPLFLTPQAKGIDRFQYQTVFNPEQKALDEIPFSHAVTQSTRVLSLQDARKMMGQHFSTGDDDGSNFAKSLTGVMAIEVVLKSGGRQVRQLWQEDKPWPVFCDNGYSACRLISARAANDLADGESDTASESNDR